MLAGTLRQTPGFDPFSVLSSFQSNVPQLEAVVDRRKVKEQNLNLNDVYTALQVYLGSAYVNDFNLFGRTYGVYVQADAPTSFRHWQPGCCRRAWDSSGPG